MVTCYLKYVIDPYKVKEFEEYGKMWIRLVNKLGGTHQGYFLPHEGANNIAYALFTFPSLAAYEEYRGKMVLDAECQEAYKFAEETKCILSYERSFMRPVFE
ncbi:NIPSNAP family protein [Metabacillus fastidiosus]|uniref:NIPSNAP family protein n=1 Tax=Metabacillus fastidiosus TaxID=1458 RepID=A0ABU6NSG1_9BACI|nr:NIPSNAP family protein [Metabacillus fastidiosus]MED4400080.1 NIPSNAP family protein [Metabacillus fastidiosus]MED4462566.1 NIPSNAP family protein [Metabacillus fastidiosus]